MVELAIADEHRLHGLAVFDDDSAEVRQPN
jgi:hypothetical protein